MKDSSELKVAIVCDWLIGGGAERVVFELHQMFPDAPIYTSFCTDQWREQLNDKVITGYLQYWPFNKIRKFIPFLRGWWFARLDLSGYDLIISSSGAEAKFIKVTGASRAPSINPKHVAYIHAPTHYYWDRYNDYLKRPGFGIFDPLARLGLKLFVGPMRKWDLRAAQRPDVLIANSTHTQKMIKKYYGRESSVIFPPVDIDRFQTSSISSTPSKDRTGFVIVGRQTPYKSIDLAVLACTQLSLPLIVIGDGPDNQKLRNLAGPSVAFMANASDDDITNHLKSAEAFIFPGLDDFGIAPVEAMAAGTPVVAYKGGGALDYVIEGKTGKFFPEQTVGSLVKCLEQFNSLTFKEKDLIEKAQSFSQDRFRDNMYKLINNKSGY